jgi:hypothetical protein
VAIAGAIIKTGVAMNTKLGERGAAQTGEPSRDQNSDRFGELQAYDPRSEVEVGRERLSGPDDFRPAFERLIARGPSNLVIDIAPGRGMLNRIPTIPSEREFASSEVEKYLTEELCHSLSEADFELFRLHRLNVPDKTALPRIRAAFDDFILQAAAHQGSIIFLMPEILQRTADWQSEGEDGERRCERLGQSLARMSRVMRGTQKASLYPWWARSRSAIIREVKQLRKSLQARFAGRVRSTADWILFNAAVDTVEADPGTFPTLGQIPVPLHGFLSAEPESLHSLIAGGLTPPLFTDELIGWATNYEPGSVPQLIRRNS